MEQNLLICLEESTPWNKMLPDKVNKFIWRAILLRLPTRSNLEKIGVSIGSHSCPICNILLETESHLFLNYLVVREVCATNNNWWNQVPVDSNSLYDLFSCVSSSGTFGCVRKVVSVVLSAFARIIWTYRCDKIFNDKVKSCSMLSSKVKMLAIEWIKYWSRNGYIFNWVDWCLNQSQQCIKLK